MFKHCSPEAVKTQMPMVIGLRFEKSFPEQFPKQKPKLFSPPAPPNVPQKLPHSYSPKPHFCFFSVVPSSCLGGKGGREEETGGRGVGRGKIIHTTGIIKQHAIRTKENATVFADTEARGNPGSCDNSWRLNGRLPPHRSTGPPTSRTQPSNVEGPGKPDTQVECGALFCCFVVVLLLLLYFCFVEKRISSTTLRKATGAARMVALAGEPFLILSLRGSPGMLFPQLPSTTARVVRARPRRVRTRFAAATTVTALQGMP